MSRCVAMVLVILAYARIATAGPARFEIVGDACEMSTLDGTVGELASSTASATETLVRIETIRRANGVAANIWFPDRDEDERGPRMVEAADCSQLLESIALVVAMAMPDASSAPPVEPPSGRVQVPTRAGAATQLARPGTRVQVPSRGSRSVVIEERDGELAMREARDGPTPQRDVTLDGYVVGGTRFGSGGARGQLIIGARLGRGLRSLALEARADAAEEEMVSTFEGIRVSRAEVSISPCLHRGGLAACAVASIGTIRGAGIDLHGSRSVFTPLVSSGLRAVWERRLAGPISIRAYVEAQALLTSTRFDVDLMPVWESDRIEGSGGLGLLARFL